MNKSETICKLLKIQPSKFRVIVENYVYCGKKHRMFITAPNFTSREEAQSHIDSITSKYEKAYIEEIKLDLTTPENFVKLLETNFIYQYGDFEEQTEDEYKTLFYQACQSGYEQSQTRDDFLDVVADCIEQKYIMTVELEEAIKQINFKY